MLYFIAGCGDSSCVLLSYCGDFVILDSFLVLCGDWLSCIAVVGCTDGMSWSAIILGGLQGVVLVMCSPCGDFVVPASLSVHCGDWACGDFVLLASTSGFFGE